jgi:hypothetical protein
MSSSCGKPLLGLFMLQQNWLNDARCDCHVINKGSRVFLVIEDGFLEKHEEEFQKHRFLEALILQQLVLVLEKISNMIV